jgi:anti-sigma factor RsiW
MMDRHWTAEEIEEVSGDDVHLSGCVQCANAVVANGLMKRRVREAMSIGDVPPRLRARLQKQRTLSTSWWMAAAAILATVLVLSALAWRRPSSTAIAELADMHATMLAAANPVDVISTDHHTVKPWFEGRVPFGVPVPDLTSTPFRLIGGRVVYWHTSQAAYLLVGKGAHRISLFIFRPQDAPRTLGTPPPSMTALSWQDKGLTFIAVADVPQGDLQQLREAFERR